MWNEFKGYINIFIHIWPIDSAGVHRYWRFILGVELQTKYVICSIHSNKVNIYTSYIWLVRNLWYYRDSIILLNKDNT